MGDNGHTEKWRPCGAKKRNGEPCRGPAMKGNTRCRLHGAASSPKANARRVATEKLGDAVAKYGLPVYNSDPAQALQDEIDRTVGNVEFLAMRLRDAGVEELVGVTTSETKSGGIDAYTMRRVEGILGPWTDLFLKERSHLHAITKTALSLGIQEKRLKVDQRYADAFEAAFLHVLMGLGRDPQDGASRALLSSAFTVAEQTLDASDAIPGKVIR